MLATLTFCFFQNPEISTGTRAKIMKTPNVRVLC